jgi:DNA-binding transcriptional MerR regulator
MDLTKKKPPLPPKLYKVGEIMKHTGVSRQTIHNYTVWGLIRAVTRTETGGHRLYGEDVFDRLRRIEMMKAHRTLTEIKAHLDAEEAAAAAGTSAK